MAQPSQPTLVNLPTPSSNPETPSEMPGTPTSTTTSLSALSTTAIKDGHRGHYSAGPFEHGHQHAPSTLSLEAERADRISRLAGLERVSTLRAPPTQSQTPSVATGASLAAASVSPQTTPTSTTGFSAGFPATQHLTPAYFDNNGQPVAATKMSTVGTASATESHVGEADDTRTTAGERDEDMLSTGTNYRSVASMGVDPDAMDEDMDVMTTRSVGGYEDRASDDGSASLVGFGEGAGSTVSGPIYHRRGPPVTSGLSHASPLERADSGFGEARRDRDTSMANAGPSARHRGGGESPVNAAAAQERRDACMMDGVAADPPRTGTNAPDDSYVDTTFRGPVPLSARQQYCDAAERLLQPLDGGERKIGASTLGSPGQGADSLGKFYFEGEPKKAGN